LALLVIVSLEAKIELQPIGLLRIWIHIEKQAMILLLVSFSM
jgi:hypothetical protein